jgi:hypothetical protein
MGDEFLYILGAGASCEAVPLVREFPRELATFANELELVPPYANFPGQMSNMGPPLFDHEDLNPIEQFIAGDGRKRFVAALKWLATEASKHASVDTLAKKFYLKNDHRSLKKLKAVLSSYLIVRQTRMPLDKRYDSFFASLLYRDEHGELQVPLNIKILTWNYDTQLEKAFYGFSENNDEVYAKISNKIHRINGCCGKTPEGHWGPDFRSVWEAPDASTAMRHGVGLFLDYLKDHNTPDADIRFAWEYKTGVYLSKILEAIKETTIAVIIGYSFPYFNREVDKQIFAALPRIGRIYLQYPEGVHASIRERVEVLTTLVRTNIQPVSSDNQFYIPDEYSGPV